MKLTDLLIKKIGADKLLHLMEAGWAVSLALDFGIAFGVFVWFAVTLFSIFKEISFDASPDWWDVGFAELGMAVSFIIYLIS